ncbi:MAG TPA: tail fiber domain-containing protein [Bacillota bacterium]|nr:tail fiber domain-containing protein [Bacillota bacterium]
MGNEIQRMHFFDGLFLTAEEFNLEQDYYRKIHYRHNRHLHGPGIVRGLEVKKSGAKEVTVSAGVALNQVHEGGEDISKEIILGQKEVIDLSKYSSGDTIYIYLSLEEKMEDIVPSKGGELEGIHWTERVMLEHDIEKDLSNKNTEHIVLAKVVFGDGGITQILLDECIYAGVSGYVLETKKLLLKADEWASQLSLEGSPQGIKVNGDIILEGKVNNRDLSADGIMLDTHVAANNNPHATTASQVGALPISGGTLTGNLNMKEAGTVDGRDVSADGTKLDTHVADKNNPHATTAAQVNALPITGGTINGNLTVSGDLGISGKVDGRRVSADGAKLDTHMADKNNPHATTAEQVGALPISGGTLTGDLNIAGTYKIDGRHVSADGTKLDSHVVQYSNPHLTTAVQVGALPIGGGTLTGDLSMTDTGKVDGRRVSADGAKLDTHVADKNNPHATNASQVGALPISGGTLTGDLSMTDTVKVDGRRVSADGAKLDTHVADKNNPHATTAEQVGALPIGGGTLTGDLSMTDTGKVDGRRVSADGAKLDTHVADKNNPHATNASQVGALPITGGTINGNLTVNGNLVMSGPAAQLQVPSSLAVGPFAIGPGDGRLMVTGSVAGVELVKRGLTTWPAVPNKGDRFVWYNQDGIVRLWAQETGEILKIDSGGTLYSTGTCGGAFLSSTGGCSIGKTCNIGENCIITGTCTIIGAGNINNVNCDIMGICSATHFNEKSSKRWKKNISPVTDALAEVNRMNPVFFDWNPEHGGKHDLGFIAEEMGEIIPELVAWDEDGKYANAIDYSRLSVIAIAAIQELFKITNDLKAENEELKAMLNSPETGAGK